MRSMIKRQLLLWLMPDIMAAHRLLQSRFGDEVGVSWSPSSSISII